MRIKRFFWFCSGANEDVIESECPHEGNKYAGIGAAILFTAILSGISVCYALNLIFANLVMSITLGIFWSLGIFNLDRYMVSSIKKTEFFIADFFNSIPRIALAVVIAVVIAKPIELRIFEKEILAQIDYEQLQYLQDIQGGFRIEREEISQLNNKIQQLYSLIKSEREVAEKFEEKAIMEADGTSGTKSRGLGGIYRLKEKRAKNARKTYENSKNNKQNQILKINSEIDRIKLTVERKKERLIKSKKEANTLLARLVAINTLQVEQPIIWWAEVFLMAFFLVLELTPILSKLMTKKGSYDAIIDRIEEQIIQRNITIVHNIKAESVTDRAIADNLNENRMELEKHKNDELLKKLMDNSDDVTNEIAKLWKQQELDKAKQMASDYANRALPNSNRTILIKKNDKD